MKKFIKTLISVVFGIVCLLMTTSKLQAISLSFEPSNVSANIGDSLNIDVIISGLSAANLAEFDLNVNYDDSILSFNSYVLGTELGDVGAGDASDWSSGDLGGGTINLAEISWLWDFSSQPDSFTLASLTFSVVNPGSTDLTFSNVILGDEWGSSLTATLESGTIQASAPVPEPATMFLMATGLAGIAGLKHKFGRSQEF